MSSTAYTRSSPQAADSLGRALRTHGLALMVLSLVAVVLYSAFSTAAKGICFGGFTADRSFVDAEGNLTSVTPSCIMATLHPIYWVIILMLVVSVAGLVVARRTATNADQAKRILGVAATVVLAIFVVAVALNLAFYLSDMSTWRAGEAPAFPFPLNVTAVLSLEN